MNEQNKKIYEKVLQLLNDAEYTKEKLSNITKEELKPFLREVYGEFGTLGILVNSQKEVWKKAVEEIINENKVKDEEKLMKKELSEINTIIEDTKVDQLNSEDYDDLIQPEFPTEYNDIIHSRRIEKLALQLENERKEEAKIRNEFENFIENEIRNREEMREKVRVNLTDDSDKMSLDEKRKEEKRNMKKKIKDNKYMKNDEFLLLLCLMRKKKEQLYENNPYIVDFSVDLDSVYQSKKEDDIEEEKELFNFFDYDLNKFVD
jgi:hypothetical protein